jgi:hypothetical protein
VQSSTVPLTAATPFSVASAAVALIEIAGVIAHTVSDRLVRDAAHGSLEGM